MVIIAQLPYNSHFTSYCFISLSNNLQDKQLPTYCGKTCNGTVVFMTTDYTNLERLIQSGRDLSKSSSSTSCSKKVLFMRTSCSCLAESISEVMELPKMFWASCSSVWPSSRLKNDISISYIELYVTIITSRRKLSSTNSHLSSLNHVSSRGVSLHLLHSLPLGSSRQQ